MTPTRRTVLLASPLAALALAGAGLAGAPAASAATVATQDAAADVAAQQAGDPYSYGAAGPDAFDCSGLTSYAYGQAGHPIPRTTGDQYAASRPIPREEAAVGDLVFLEGGGHVGLYAGNGEMWDAPHEGEVVQRRAIWSDDYEIRRP